MKLLKSLTQSRLRELFHYEPASGVFTRLIRKGGTKKPGRKKPGYQCMRIDGVMYLSHRLAWLYVYGRWPKGILDHANGDTTDNRISNIRECTHGQNRVNSVRDKTKKYDLPKGVSMRPEKPKKQYFAQLCQKHLGYFETPDEAHQAYLKASQNRYGEFARGA